MRTLKQKVTQIRKNLLEWEFWGHLVCNEKHNSKAAFLNIKISFLLTLDMQS